VNPGNGTTVTVGIPMGSGQIGAGYGKRSASASTEAQFGDDVKQTFVGYRYNLSKRTNVQFVTNKIDRAGTAKDVTENHVYLAHSF
jgi:predicted porin